MNKNDCYKIDFLVQTKLFKKELIIKEKIIEKNYKQGQFISDYFAGQFYIGVIASGKVDVFSISSDGNETQISNLKKYDVFGVSNIFSEICLETVLKCKSDVKVYFYPKSEFIKLLEKDSYLSIQYCKFCNNKIQFLLKKIEFLTIQSSKNKIIEFLLNNDQNTGKVELDHSKEELTKILGVSRASLFRELSKFQNEGYLRIDGKNIEILQKDKIESILYYS
ncbi:Hypothetical protein CM240_3235 [Clostridium bornimense]|uniref:Uncharacterized protein n=1 Tax=Clostridium bornimense TaxID=1216932 RepID=W6S7G6_9CLOT|nr:Crp/Fnr family transcriptional regulator [Clostridium bornimense]CDM70352.1 Hypothetical protein CM240_3235 [Clostridium bornimense]